jgi:lipoyl(octanoyl) transferase
MTVSAAPKKNKTVLLQDLGLMDYKEAWDFQESLFQEVVKTKMNNRRSQTHQPTQNHLLLVEHPHVYTLGKSGDIDHLLINNKQLADKNAAFYKINRGGDITYHGPGQMVVYPILDLDNFFTDIHKYLRLLEEAAILTLADFGITATRSTGETGVWLDVGTPFARKICALGVKASRWVTMHGLALNIQPDLGYFDHIVPCGIQGKAVTSMAVECNSTTMDTQKVKNRFVSHFQELFGAQLDTNF